ncbi:hypothetical protein HK101_011637 [Irineochytrium annulatum]|nr:hypothetical protein HK101_011637 [Irineochytrium annulatum]
METELPPSSRITPLDFDPFIKKYYTNTTESVQAPIPEVPLRSSLPDSHNSILLEYENRTDDDAEEEDDDDDDFFQDPILDVPMPAGVAGAIAVPHDPFADNVEDEEDVIMGYEVADLEREIEEDQAQVRRLNKKVSSVLLQPVPASVTGVPAASLQPVTEHRQQHVAATPAAPAKPFQRPTHINITPPNRVASAPEKVAPLLNREQKKPPAPLRTNSGPKQVSVPAGFDFSKIDLKKYSAEELEALYSAKHLAAASGPMSPPVFSEDNIPGLHPHCYPTSMNVSVERLEIPGRAHDRPVSLRVVFRGKKLKPIQPELQRQREIFEASLTYHSLLFDVLKVDVHEKGGKLSSGALIGRARVRLADLTSLNGSVVQVFDLLPRKEGKVIGGVLGSITLSFDFARSVEDDEDDSIGPDDSASLVGDLGDEELASQFGPPTNKNGQPVAGQPTTDTVVEEFMGYFRAIETSTTIGSPTTLGSSLSSPASAHPAISAAGTILKFDAKRRGTMVSPRTMTGLREMSDFAAAFFNQGWKISKLEFAKAALLVGKWQYKHQPQKRTHDVVTDLRKIRVANYFLRFAIATYGTFVMNYVGAGKGFLRDTLRAKADQKCARDHLGLGRHDMLEWEFSGTEAFKPKFFVCWDDKTKAIVVSIRGSLNTHDIITDLCAEYEPYRTGFVHRGMLRCAIWLEHNLLPLLKQHVVRRKARALYVVGHSLGAAIASIFAMMTRDSSALAELKLAGESVGVKGFKMHCFAYACPPCVSADLAELQKGWIDSYVNENDMVPRLSYGSMVDFREVMICAAESLRNGSLSEKQRFELISERSRELREGDKYPKVYCPGNVYYVYKTSRVLRGEKVLDHRRVKVGLSGNKIVDDETPHYVMELSDKANFVTVMVKINMLYHHFPNKYENGMMKAHDWILEEQEATK